MKPTALTFLGGAVLLLAAGLLFLPVVAFAGGAEKDGGEVRTITATSATSDCIGDPRTPVCAVETLLACFARQDRGLCEKATRRKVELNSEQGSYRYRVLSVRILQEKDITPELRDADWWRPGYADVMIQDLDFIQPWCPKGCKVGYSVRPTATGWEVLEWAGEGVE
jgi:hypothetical protein